MPASKVKSLSSLFRLAAEKTIKSASKEVNLKRIVPSLDPSSSAFASSDRVVESLKAFSRSKRMPDSEAVCIDTSKLDRAPPSDNPEKELTKEISSILCGDISLVRTCSPDSSMVNNDQRMESHLEIPWFSSNLPTDTSIHQKEISRCRKQKWIFRNTQTRRFDRLIRLCAEKLGASTTLQVLGKLGRESGVKEYNALIGICIDEARKIDDEEVLLKQIYKAYQLFKSMCEQGFQLDEETYGPLLMFLIDMEMVEEFQVFCGVIRNENPDSISRLAYYEMLLWIRAGNDDRIKELCDYIASNDDDDQHNFRENYLLALCDSDRKEELLTLLEIIDITKFKFLHLTNIFKSMGRLFLESFMEKFILALKSCDIGAENISDLIYNYAVSVPNLAVEDVISKFNRLHEKLELLPCSASYTKLISYCCDSSKVHVALDVLDQMPEAGLSLSIETIHSMLHACEESCDYNLVHRIYLLICQHNLKPSAETFRSMINLCARMKDFAGAYNMIKDSAEMNLRPTSGMYNSIMAGFFREKNTFGALMVLKKMEDAGVKPDSDTFMYLIGNCDREEDIAKYYEELKHSGVKISKQIFMALINAYAACGQFEKAKQVVLDKRVPIKSLSEIKSVLVSALVSKGHISDALNIYEEIKDAECNLEPKSVVYLMEGLQTEGELSRLLQLLDELKDPGFWIDGCFTTILYCVQYKHLDSIVHLLKQLKDKFSDDDAGREVLFDEVFCKIAETEPIDVQFGLDLLQAIKEELLVRPSRKSLDFLLGACVNAKDLHGSRLVWKEYQTAGLPYNGFNYLRMYQALLASGDYKSAKDMLKKVPKHDAQVRCLIKACQATYIMPASFKGKKTKGMARK
ncbi:pentatricopeptide repeat-containing protein At4g04790, mitochondrial isoform X2 [Diospyros lotus]|uniref:pentatricopeptide repeat-containing protein At4g04790, mitochondrial isoform X2 n=1 Tax=Diospyros lotus TaxID=55363 RepID=UPI00225345CC|nr:pentatricopeptide repeat-containing protein At4g04790, mitochondrial isoform X2 [Diospyros lotus]